MPTTTRIHRAWKSKRLVVAGAAIAVLLGAFGPRVTAQQDDTNATAPRLIRKVEPDYTPEARDAGLEGTVVLGVEVGTDGRAHDIRVTRSLDQGLDEKAVEAVRSWEFEPGTRGGEPVPVKATIEVNFRLN